MKTKTCGLCQATHITLNRIQIEKGKKGFSYARIVVTFKKSNLITVMGVLGKVNATNCNGRV